jgi:hypothetical protein
MRYRLMATYLGVPYHAGLGPDGNEATLFSPGPPPEELGFSAGPGHWRKQVDIAELQALWQSRLVGEYRGEPCLVLEDFGERLHIVYLGRDAVRARQLGYWEIDREVFEVVVLREDVADLTEERTEFPLSAATFPPSSPAPPPGARLTGPQPAADPLSRVLPAAGTVPPGAEPEADTLIHARLGPLGRPEPRPRTEATGPRTRMEPTGARPPAEPGVSPDTSHGPRTPDRMAAWHGSPASEPWSEPWPARAPRADPRSDPRSEPRGEPRSEPRAQPVTRSEPQPPQPGTGPEPWFGARPGPSREPEPGPWAGPAPAAPPGRRTARKDRVSPQSVFAELLNLAGIPQVAYAVDEEVPGAMCVVKTDGGFEVFSCTDGERLEVHFFEEEEAAYFYLFGVLAAEAVRSGRLGATRSNGHVNGSRGPGPATTPAAAREDVKKYLQSRKLHKSPSHAVIVN